MECKVKGMVCEVKDNFGNVEKDYMGWLVGGIVTLNEGGRK